MKPLNDNVLISAEILAECTLFAETSVEFSADKYASRNQFNFEKIKNDIKCGKIGEFIVYNKLINNYPNLSKPDLKIYSISNKSWQSDLISPCGIEIAVKSQNISSSIEYSDSWVFQGAPGKTKDTDTGIFKNTNPNHYVAFVSLNTPKKTGKIRSIVKVSWLIDNNLFKAMQKENLRGNKVAVYYDDLLGYPDQLWQL